MQPTLSNAFPQIPNEKSHILRFQPPLHRKHLIRSREPSSPPFPDRPQKHHQTPPHHLTHLHLCTVHGPRTQTHQNHPTILSKPSSLPKNRKRGRPPSRLDQLGPKIHFAFSYNGIRNERPFFYVHNCDRLRGAGRFWSAFKHEKLGFDSVDFSRCVDEY